MKGVVLSGGSGTRLRPITYSIAKQLVPVAGAPVLFHGLRELAAAGIEEVALIVSPETGDQVRAAIEEAGDLGIRATFIVQSEPKGLAHALRCALPFLDGDDCVMYLGDNLVDGGVRAAVDGFRRTESSCQVLVAHVDHPEAFGVVEVDAAGGVLRLVEKPKVPQSNLAIIGVYVFDRHIAQAVEAIEPSWRGEYEITDAIQHLVDSGRPVGATVLESWWKDTGRKEDILDANRIVLGGLQASIEGELVACTVEGPVSIEAGSRLVDCTLIGPVIVGRGVEARNARIGPNVAIDRDCRIEGGSIVDTVVMWGSEIVGWDIVDSLIGPESQMRPPAPTGAVSLTLGQRTMLGAD